MLSMQRSRLARAAVCLLALMGADVARSAADSLEVRFCGPQPLHPYPLSSEAALHGLLLPYVLVINRGTEHVELASVGLDLLRDGAVLETRSLGRPELDSFGQLSQQYEAAPAGKMSLALLCGDQLVPAGFALGGPTLAPRQGLLILNQAFAYQGQRDSLRVRASGHAPHVIADARLPVSMIMAKTQYRFPVRGVWLVKSGPSFHTHHRWARPSEFGLDLVKLTAEGRSYRGDGSRLVDYYAYGEEVLAAADGRVVRAVNDRPEPRDLLLRAGETFEEYTGRTAAHAQMLLKAGVDGITGNHVMIDHRNGEYSLYAHLQSGSVRVKVGDEVRAGDRIAKLGGSGNALVEPHLHFHVCDRPAPLACSGIPVEFINTRIPFASFASRPIQSGDIVVAE